MTKQFNVILAAAFIVLIGDVAIADPPESNSTSIPTPPTKGRSVSNTNQLNCDLRKMRYYPEEAQRVSESGFAVVQCLIKDDGGMQDCTFLSESPSGYGFGAKAVELATCLYHIKLGPDGKAIGAGTIFKKRVDFKLQ
jgi:TonB family protein